jgi:hypothetical protein
MRNHLAAEFHRARGRIVVVAVAGAAALVAAVLIPAASASTRAGSTTAKNPICSRLGSVGVSAGAHMYCQGPVNNSTTSRNSAVRKLSRSTGTPKNVNAARLHEDIAPRGVRAYGQSEESVAAVGKDVVEAWNDSTGFFVLGCVSSQKEQLTGYGFSANGGKTFTDEGGLPVDTTDCNAGWRFEGDPSVEGISSGGTTYFYISSLYINIVTGQSDIAFDTCTVSGKSLTCNRTPTVVAAGVTPSNVSPGDFLDKDYLALDPDPTRHRLYATYTRFSPTAPNGQVELAACNISTAATPVCDPGTSTTPYYVVQPPDVNGCEHEGAYPAVDPSTGDVYVAWEYNWATNFLVAACANTRTQERVAFVPNSCLTLPTSTCTSPATQVSININSLDAAFIPGFNRNPGAAAPANDFPRIAVSDKSKTVTIVWNDVGRRATGDILMQSYGLGASLTPVQSHPVRLNNNKGATWNFMPGLRNADKSGLLDVIWFDRRNSNPSCEACTDVYAALKVSPKATKTPKSNVRITNVSSNWNAQSSDVEPNFGDYTDDLVVGKFLYTAWADGRLSDPQPFFARLGG